MSNEEMVSRIQGGEESLLAELYEQNRGFLYGIAKHYSHYAELEDLMQEAYFGLYEAARRYETGGVKFLTYAAHWVKQSLRRYVEENGQAVRIPAHMYQTVQQYKRFLGEFPKQEGRTPTDRECCSYLNIDRKKLLRVKEVYSTLNQIDSLNTEIPDGEGATVEDFIPSGEDLEGAAVDRIMEEKLHAGLWEVVREHTSELENQVIEYRYRKNLTLEATGAQMGVSRDKARQYEAVGLRKLRTSRVKRILHERFDVVPSCAYRGGLSQFRYTFTSSTERAAIKELEGFRL